MTLPSQEDDIDTFIAMYVPIDENAPIREWREIKVRAKAELSALIDKSNKQLLNEVVDYLYSHRTADNTDNPDVFYATLSKQDLKNLQLKDGDE